MSRESHAFFDVIRVGKTRLTTVIFLCLGICIAAGCAGEKPAKKATEKEKEQVVTDLNIKTDSDDSAVEKNDGEKKKDELETLPFDEEETESAETSSPPALNAPD